LLQLVGGGGAVGVLHDLHAHRVVRHQVDDVAADAAAFELLEVGGDVGGAGTAVAGDDGGHALHEIAKVGAGGRLEQGGVAVRVQVDEAGGCHQAGRVDAPRFAGDGETAHGDDALAADGEVALDTGRTAAVVQHGVLQHAIGLDRRVGGGQQREQQQRGP